MKITYIETFFIDGEQLLGSDGTSVCKELITQRKLDNAIQKHKKKISKLTEIHPRLKKGYTIKYNSIYK